MNPDSANPTTALARLDPRLRVVFAVLYAVTVAVLPGFHSLIAALAVAALCAVFSGLGWRRLIRASQPVNLVVLVLVAVLPLTAGGGIVSLGPLALSREGLELAGQIALKANAIVLVTAALLGTMEIVTLGHALHHLRVPEKLVHLLLMTVRYVDVLDQQRKRLRTAMRVRGFRPRANRHTYRSYGYLVGMLLVTSVDRAERITAAMRCRGFHGRFYLLDHFHFRRSDVAPSLALALGWLLIVIIQSMAIG